MVVAYGSPNRQLIITSQNIVVLEITVRSKYVTNETTPHIINAVSTTLYIHSLDNLVLIVWNRHAFKHWGRDKTADIFETTFSNAFSWMKIAVFW